ncbi:hypothetical protein R3P38DRAFT_2863604 [Favolaschia claudopus]|uniref:Uncharacterized protein n=1 Tax=Favolaschia claudopus TaxID=2862362 RepID=A0AAW0DFB4_9AGAR
MDDGACPVRIKSAKCDSDCPSSYAFQIRAASTFRDTRPCTNVPISCPFDCQQTHWKYNFPQHLKERHPSWQTLVSQSFIEQITVTREEELKLGIPESKAVLWPPPPAPQPPSSPSCGQKRPAPGSPRTPRGRYRLHCKEPQNGKFPRVFWILPGAESTSQRIAPIIGDVFT